MDLFSQVPSPDPADDHRRRSSGSGSFEYDSHTVLTESTTDAVDYMPPITLLSGSQAAADPDVTKRVSFIFNESFGYRPDGLPYRLGPKSTAERLLQTDYVYIVGGQQAGVGYLFGKEIPSSAGRIAWIESMAVLPLYRGHGIGTALVRRFAEATKAAPRLGCATPNPIAALIVSRVVQGKLYIGSCFPPYRLMRLLKEIRQHCFDLRGCFIDEASLTIKTGFSPLSRSDQREWHPRKPQQEPMWWKAIQSLPNEYEALLIMERES
jgi:GNAT superfamily N-acetyltransferase